MIKHQGTVYVCGRFSVKEIGAFHLLSINTAMNVLWYKKFLIEELLPSIDDHFPNKNCGKNLRSIIQHTVNISQPASTRDLQDFILHEWNSIDKHNIQN